MFNKFFRERWFPKKCANYIVNANKRLTHSEGPSSGQWRNFQKNLAGVPDSGPVLYIYTLKLFIVAMCANTYNCAYNCAFTTPRMLRSLREPGGRIP